MLANDKIEGLQDFLGLLTSVNDKGWDAGYRDSILRGRERSVSTHSHAEPLLSLRHALDDAKRFLASLDSVKQRLTKEIRKLQRRCAPLLLEDGIKRLPDDLLSHIFKIGHDITDYCDFALAVSHVSCRFRQVSLRTPRLWTRVSIEYPSEQIDVFMSRSGQLDLEISERFSLDFSDSCRFFKLLAPVSTRWSSLTIISDRSKEIIRKLDITNFPRLRRIYKPSASLFGVDLSSWHMPSLSIVEVDVSQFTQLCAVPMQLTCIELQFMTAPYVDVVALFRALLSMKTLKDLSLILFNCGSLPRIDHLDRAELPQPHSVHLDRLAIEIEQSPYDSLVDIYDKLSVFMATNVYLSIDRVQDHRESYLLNSRKEYFLHGSTIRIHIQQSCDISNILMLIAKHCKIAHTVHLDLPSAYTGFMSDQD
ncbi:hypothetical protein BD410DRAFT_297932 [Rickenella mellea]|uniref:Uncharacterized protein n=1 Tax=Rickenella mellea TaxID=50990 RepID=A0A4Y7PHX4_9AGAM|nr:hypothetical protein BD410DRAFT_297932 [Rickenella mellea]